jgi:hypothetical protein
MIFWFSCDGNKQCEGLSLLNIGRAALGVKLLRGAVTRYRCFIEEMAIKRASKVVESVRLLPQLRDPCSELLLLRLCIGITKKKLSKNLPTDSYKGDDYVV